MIRDREVHSRVGQLLVREFEVSAERLTDDVALREGLGLDPLGAVDLLVALEEEFGVRMDEDKSKGVETVRDVYDYALSMISVAEEAGFLRSLEWDSELEGEQRGPLA